MNEEVVAIIAEVLGVTSDQIHPDLSIGDIPAWSSMAQMRLISTLEQRMEIEFPIEDLFDLTSVQALIDEVNKVKNV